MRPFIRSIFFFFILSLTLNSCSDLSTTHETEKNAQGKTKQTTAKVQTSQADYDEYMQKQNQHFMHLAELIPGFGGIYLEEKGSVIVIRATNLDKLDKASIQSKVKNYLAKETPNIRSEAEGGVQAMEIRFEEATYEYIQLHEWHDQILPLILNQDGVTFVSLSHKENKIRVGVEENRFEKNAFDIINANNLPEQAFSVSVTGKVQHENHTLRDFVRPLIGGLGWELETDNFFDILGYGRCTYGFNAEQNNISYWVTNSHCTEQYWSVDPITDYYQHSSSSGSPIGNEAYDPYGTTSIPLLCSSSRPCRYSDSALIEHSPGVAIDFGEIARTNFPSVPGQGPGSLGINHNKPNFSIQNKATEDHFIEGQWVNKMGQRTGWTVGQITDVSVIVNGNFQGQDYRLLFQTFATYLSNNGDSGSPVFDQPLGEDDVTLYGIHWGRLGNSAIFSKIKGVELDLGALTVY